MSRLKVALIISGQPRFYSEACYDSIKREILDVYDVDVFLHTWYTPGYVYDYFCDSGITSPITVPHTCQQDLLSLYKPKKHLFQEPLESFTDKNGSVFGEKFFTDEKISKDYQNKNQYISRAIYSMFSSIFISLLLKVKYSTENNVKYDWVIRARYDTLLGTLPKLETLPRDTMYVPDNRLNHDCVNDTFALCPGDLADEAFSVFRSLDTLVEKYNSIAAEYLWMKHLQEKNIPFQKLNFFQSFSRWWGGPRIKDVLDQDEYNMIVKLTDGRKATISCLMSWEIGAPNIRVGIEGESHSNVNDQSSSVTFFPSRLSLAIDHYYSQYGQDRYVNEHYFHGARGGFYVDVGAHDGVDKSNTYFLEGLKWRGICLEPNPPVYEKLKNNRSHLCIPLHYCAYDSNCSLKFLQCKGYTEMLSGIVDAYHPEHLKRVHRENGQYNGLTETIEVEAIRLQHVLDKYEVKTIDYLSIDVEGSELNVIAGIDFSKVKVNVINVEENHEDVGLVIKKHLEDNGFISKGKLGCDLVFENKEIKWSWE